MHDGKQIDSPLPLTFCSSVPMPIFLIKRPNVDSFDISETLRQCGTAQSNCKDKADQGWRSTDYHTDKFRLDEICQEVDLCSEFNSLHIVSRLLLLFVTVRQKALNCFPKCIANLRLSSFRRRESGATVYQ